MSEIDQIPGDDDIDIDDIHNKRIGTTITTNGIITRNFVPNCLNRLIKIIFSPPGLVVLVVIYSVMGAFIFPLLEAPRDIKNNVAIAQSREDCLRELWTITEKLNVLYEKNWTMLVHEQLRRFEGSIVAATRNGGLSVINESDQSTTRWSFSEALLYSVTVITTIGHGNLTPKTSGGKIVTIFYALIGVPLMLMCLSSLGGLLAEALQCTYIKFCCARNREQQAKNNRTKNLANTSTTTSSCIGQSHHEVNCNMCKYDGVNCETKLHNNYEYTAVSEREDSCHLLRNSPSKMNHHHSSPCMQVKSHPIIKQYCLQQKSDLTSSSSSSLSPLKHNQLNKQQQQQQQQIQLQQHSPQHYHQMTLPHNYRTSCRNAGQTATTDLSNNIDGSGGSIIGGGNGGICLPPPPPPHGTTTTAVYFPITQSAVGNHFTCNSAAIAAFHYNHQQQQQQQQQQQPLVKYHTIQLQQHGSNHGGGQTATVHGIRRGKYIPKPMPPEINMLLAESDISSAYNKSDSILSTNDQIQATTVLTDNVDIMEDEEENEQNRMGCPHGTPSRIPLIAASVNSTPIRNVGLMDIEEIDDRCQTLNRNNSNKKFGTDITTNAGGGANDLTTINNNQHQQINENLGPQVPITIVLCILTGYICLGTVIFAFWENWSFIDGAYFCFVTLSTIGYGDFLPQHTIKGPDVQLFACCAYLLLGLVLVAMSFSILETQLMWKCKRIAVRLKLTKD